MFTFLGSNFDRNSAVAAAATSIRCVTILLHQFAGYLLLLRSLPLCYAGEGWRRRFCGGGGASCSMGGVADLRLASMPRPSHRSCAAGDLALCVVQHELEDEVPTSTRER